MICLVYKIPKETRVITKTLTMIIMTTKIMSFLTSNRTKEKFSLKRIKSVELVMDKMFAKFSHISLALIKSKDKLHQTTLPCVHLYFCAFSILIRHAHPVSTYILCI